MFSQRQLSLSASMHNTLGSHIIYPWDDPTRHLYWGAMALLPDGVGVEVCPLVMVEVMKAFLRIVVDQDEQILHSTVRVHAKRSSASCVRQSVPHSNIILNTAKAAATRYVVIELISP